MDINETTELILMVTNYGAGEVLDAIRDIATGMQDTQRSIKGVTGSDVLERMWSEIASAVSPVASKVERIENKYKGMIESRKMIMDAIQNAARQQQEDDESPVATS